MHFIYLCFGIAALALLAAVIYSFNMGWHTLRNSRAFAEPYRQTLRFLALLLCEPLLTLCITAALFRLQVFPQPNTASVLLLTTPMALLLAPVFGLRESDSFYRRLNIKILAIGLTRWLLSIAIVLLSEIGWAELSMLLTLIACLFVPFVIFWSKDRMDDILIVYVEHAPET